MIYYFSFFFHPLLRTFVFFIAFRKRNRGRKGERETLIGCLPYEPRPGTTCTPTRNWMCNLGSCPDRKSNPQPFGYGSILQPAETHKRRWGTIYSEEKVFPGCESAKQSWCASKVHWWDRHRIDILLIPKWRNRKEVSIKQGGHYPEVVLIAQ